jgi:hypothetical protein
MAEPRPVLVLHGIGTRDEPAFRTEVAALGEALGPTVRLIPLYWGDLGAPGRPLDPVLPYLAWSAADSRQASLGSAEVRTALADRDLGGVLDAVSTGWRRRGAESRRRVLGSIFSLVRTQYLRASGEFTGDLIIYQRRYRDLHARVWETVMTHAPGYGLADRPIDVITHSLGATIAFDMATAGLPRLHVGTLLSCASQVAYFHVIGCSPPSVDPGADGQPVTLPATLRGWTNFFVPLDPWAFLAAPLFTLADGSRPHDVEVYSGQVGDRVLTHAASYYWTHPIFVATARQALA